MSTSITAIKSAGVGAWVFSWSEGTAPYTIYVRGRQMATTSDISMLIHGDDYVPPWVEVIDSTQTEADVLALKTPSWIHIQWRGDPQSQYYRIDRKAGEEWVVIGLLRETGRGYYDWPSQNIPDGTVDTWRIAAVDSQGADRDYLEFATTMVTIPEAPDVVFTYDGESGMLTASER